MNFGRSWGQCRSHLHVDGRRLSCLTASFSCVIPNFCKPLSPLPASLSFCAHCSCLASFTDSVRAQALRAIAASQVRFSSRVRFLVVLLRESNMPFRKLTSLLLLVLGHLVVARVAHFTGEWPPNPGYRKESSILFYGGFEDAVLPRD